MNKKKFLATCTLVAFGSTMLPAFAFAAAGDTTTLTVLSAAGVGYDFDVNTTSPSNTQWKLDELKITKNGEDVKAYFDLPANDPAAGTALTITSKDALPVGSYVIKDSDDSGYLNVVAAAQKQFTVTAKPTDVGLTQADAVKMTIDITGLIDEDGQSVTNYSGMGLFAISSPTATPGATDTAVVAVASTNEITDATKLTPGQYYAIAAKDASDVLNGVPVAVVQYTTANAAAIKANLDALDAVDSKVKAELQKTLDAIPNEVTLSGDGAANATTNVIDTMLRAKYKQADGKALAKVYVPVVYGALKDYVTIDTPAKMDGTQASEAAFNLRGSKESFTGKADIVVVKDGVQVKKTITLTIKAATVVDDAAVAKAYADKYLSNYDSTATPKTANLTLSKVGDVVPVENYVTVNAAGVETPGKVQLAVKAGSSYAFNQAFDATKFAVKELPVEDVTGTVTATFGTASIDIKVTIKAAGQTGDLEQLEKEYRAAEEVVLDKIAELTAAQGKLTVAQLNDLYKAYKPYKEAKAAYYAAKGE